MTVNEMKFEPHQSGGWKSKTKVKDNVEISIVCGEFFYCSPRQNLPSPLNYNSYEVAVFRDGEFTREFFDSDHCDDVIGWLSIDDIASLINKIKKS